MKLNKPRAYKRQFTVLSQLVDTTVPRTQLISSSEQRKVLAMTSYEFSTKTPGYEVQHVHSSSFVLSFYKQISVNRSDLLAIDLDRRNHCVYDS